MSLPTPNVQSGHLYNKTETAELLGISRITLRKYTRLGRIHSQSRNLVGRDLYSAGEILEAWARISKTKRKRICSTSKILIGKFNTDLPDECTMQSSINALKAKFK